MDREQTEAKMAERELQMQQLPLPFKSKWPTATIAKGGVVCVILSRSELASSDLSHLQMFPATAAAMASSPTPTPSCVNAFALPVLKTKAVLDAEQADDQSLEAPSILTGRSRRPRKKAFSMDEIALYSQLCGDSKSGENGMEMKQSGDGGVMHGSECKSREDEFLVQVMPWEIAPLPPCGLSAAAAVPFKWEDAPGKPKAQAVAPPQHRPRLQLPPRLYAPPTPRRPKNTSRSNLLEKDEKIPDASSPSSTLQAFDAQSPASSTSPTDHSSSCSADHPGLPCVDISRERPNSFITPSSSPATDFGPVDGTKGFRHLYSAAQNIKQAVKTLNRSRYGGRGMHRSMDFDSREVWSPTLAMYYQLHGNERDECSKFDKTVVDEGGGNDPKVVHGQLSADPTLSSTPATTQSVELSCRSMNRSRLRKWIVSKMRRSYSLIASNSFTFPRICSRPKLW